MENRIQPSLLPFQPEFNSNAILAVVLIFLVSATETIGDTSALATSGLGRNATVEELSGSLSCDGFISSVSALFGNVGLVAMTGVVNRFAIAARAVIMILAGIFPVFGIIVISDLQLIQTVFAENCVAVVFLVAAILNLVLPKNMESAMQDKNEVP